ncbi:hypothetical protein [Actinoplanes sp. GCM10030250]|uniref:hypothetical protein n=1 Tax=Actinoplanes sp. GCM10030250 TaxID=3273376 RepID=UPI00360BDD14
MTRYDVGRRLEPIRPVADLDRGFRAEIADPIWFLARQWQLAEHQGEDAASPVQVRHVTSHDPIDPLSGDPATDPSIVPAEAIIESEPDEWWTPGRRIRLGLAAAPFVAEDPALLLAGLPVPYDRFDGTGLDGLTLYRGRAALNLPDGFFDEVPGTAAADRWDPAELVYSATFTSATVTLRIPRHDGGDVDWYSVRADQPQPAPAEAPKPVTVLPARLKYPGAPHPRWWQIENAHVDVGGFPPDRSHLATMLLIDLVVSHADDWYSFPVQTHAGRLVTLREVVVRDAFDDETPVGTPDDWSLFRMSGSDPATLAVWPTVVAPLSSQPVDDVVLGVDEDANLLWAVEQRAAGKALAAPPPAEPVLPPGPNGAVLASEPIGYAYRPSTLLPRFWHPYEVRDLDNRRRFVQGRLADLEVRPPVLMPEPVSPLLYDPAASPEGPVHQVEPATVPVTGLRLQRQWVLGRRTDGLPVLWMQRRRLPLLGPPISGLRFDVAQQVPATVTG